MADSTLPSLFSLWDKVQEKSSLAGSSSHEFVVPELKKCNDMVYLVHEPPQRGKPQLEVVFFHGLQLQHFKDPHVTTWMTRDNSQCWLQTWLVESFPKARIFTVSYDSSAMKTPESGRMDMYQTGENLVSDLTGDGVGLGQEGCPVVLVGHCLGGLVMKEVCLFADTTSQRNKGRPRAQRASAFLANLKGMFFYGTPHTGSMLADMMHEYFKGAGALSEEGAGELLEEIEILKASSTRRNESFMQLKYEKKWSTFGIGESSQTYVHCIGKYIRFGCEASTRAYEDEYYTAKHADHYEICKPTAKTDSTYRHLCGFFRSIQEDGFRQRHTLAGNPYLLPDGDLEMAGIRGITPLTKDGWDALFKRTFPADGHEKLEEVRNCFYKTKARRILGTLFVSNKKIAFYTTQPIFYSPHSSSHTAQLTYSFHRVCIPMDRIETINPFVYQTNPFEHYVLITTKDKFEFWFMEIVKFQGVQPGLSRPLWSVLYSLVKNALGTNNNLQGGVTPGTQAAGGPTQQSYQLNQQAYPPNHPAHPLNPQTPETMIRLNQQMQQMQIRQNQQIQRMMGPLNQYPLYSFWRIP
ncbi:unnamed protein product [Calypogeia fissa]